VEPLEIRVDDLLLRSWRPTGAEAIVRARADAAISRRPSSSPVSPDLGSPRADGEVPDPGRRAARVFGHDQAVQVEAIFAVADDENDTYAGSVDLRISPTDPAVEGAQRAGPRPGGARREMGVRARRAAGHGAEVPR